MKKSPRSKKNTALPSWINFEVSGRTLPTELWRAYCQIKRAAAAANARAKKLPANKARAIIAACREIEKQADQIPFGVDVFQAGAGTSTNMRLNELIAAKAQKQLHAKSSTNTSINPRTRATSNLKIDAHDHVNLSQSTNDTFHAALLIAAHKITTDSLLPALRRYEQALQKKIKSFDKIIKAGRTHLQDAVPLTLGQEFRGFSIEPQIKNLEQALAQTLELPLGGTAVGTGLNAGGIYTREVYRQLKIITGLSYRRAANPFSAQQQLSLSLRLSAVARSLAVAFTKIANDLRLLTAGPAAINEVVLPAVVAGSSIMPGKINPSVAEMLNMVAQQVIGHDQTILQAALAGQMELNVFMPLVADNLLRELKILSGGVDIFTKKALVGIKPNLKIIKQNLAKNTMVVTALSGLIGYKKAADLALLAKKTGQSIFEVASQNTNIDPKKLKKILDPRRLINNR